METITSIASINNAAPKLLAPFSAVELAEALVYFTVALSETVDFVFLARNDRHFLTDEHAGDLRVLQTMAQCVAEATALQMANDSFYPMDLSGGAEA